MGQNVNLAQQVAVQNVCCVFYYFCGGHKNNFPIWFRSSCKTFYNGRKIPIILPILKDGKLESDFKIQVNYFNFFFFFASQCIPQKTNYSAAARLTSI